VIKEPIWTWEIPLYFFTGGLAGASAGFAYLSELRGDDELARRAWGTALVGVALSPALLTSDLGRPARFVNMLRMFKVTSPMSVGSWILSGSAISTALAAGNSWFGLFPRAGSAAKPAAALLGLPLSTYTAALISNTAIPAWHQAHRLLPYVFGSGAALSAGAAAVAVTPPEHAQPARRLALGAAILEGPLMEIMAHRLGGHGEPYKHGAAAKFSNLSRACIVGGTLLLLRAGSSRLRAAAAAATLATGAVATRWCIFRAGFQSASNPKYVISPQRAEIEQGKRRGGARSEPRIAAGSPAQGSPATQ
jgi:hypothetical protein